MRNGIVGKLKLLLAALSSCVFMIACQSMRPIETVNRVDIDRFMGRWYVIAAIPTFIEKESYNAVETYRKDADATIATTFTFNKGDFEGPLKKYTPRAWVRPGTGNAVWGMQFIWPFKAEYRITYLNPDYTRTIIGRSKRDYAWIMARTATISEPDYRLLLQKLADQGYDISSVRRVPHRP